MITTKGLSVAIALAWLALAGAANAQAPAPFRDCATCPDMVTVPANADPARPTAAFALAKTPVTVGEFALFARDTGYVSTGYCYSLFDRDNRASENVHQRWWGGPGFVQGEDHPVVCVGPEDALAYMQWLSLRAGKSYRLPAVDEYERAMAATQAPARGNRRNASSCDSNLLDKAASQARPPERDLGFLRCDDGYARTSPVTAFAANALGLFDISANVYALAAGCNDAALAPGVTAPAPATATSCTKRLAMGRSWATGTKRPATRLDMPVAGYHTTYIGFRVARALD